MTPHLYWVFLMSVSETSSAPRSMITTIVNPRNSIVYDRRTILLSPIRPQNGSITEDQVHRTPLVKASCHAVYNRISASIRYYFTVIDRVRIVLFNLGGLRVTACNQCVNERSGKTRIGMEWNDLMIFGATFFTKFSAFCFLGCAQAFNINIVFTGSRLLISANIFIAR